VVQAAFAQLPASFQNVEKFFLYDAAFCVPPSEAFSFSLQPSIGIAIPESHYSTQKQSYYLTL